MPTRRVAPNVARRLFESAQGINYFIALAERDYNLELRPNAQTLTVSGKDEEIITLALDALEHFANETKSKATKTLGTSRTVIWTYRDRQAKHFRHLFFDDLMETKSIETVDFGFSPDEFNPMLLGIGCEQHVHEILDVKMKELEKLLQGCQIKSVKVNPREKQLAKQFEKRPDDGQVYSRVYFGKELVFYGRSQAAVQTGISEWETFVECELGTVIPPDDGEIKRTVPVNIVGDLRRLKGGIKPIINKLKTDFLLTVVYSDEGGTMVLKGDNDDIVQMALNVLINMSSTPNAKINTNKVLGTRGTVIWTFKDNTARHFKHLFANERQELRSVDSTFVRFSPNELNPLSVEIKCGQPVYERVNAMMKGIIKNMNIIVKTVPVQTAEKDVAKMFEKLLDNDKVYCRLYYSGKEFLFYGRTAENVDIGVDEWENFKIQQAQPAVEEKQKNPKGHRVTFLVDKSDDSADEDHDDTEEVPEQKTEIMTYSHTDNTDKTNSERQSSLSCPVCKDSHSKISADQRKLMSTTCGHVFCQPCIEKAYKGNKSCPVCKTKLKKADVNFVTLLKI